MGNLAGYTRWPKFSLVGLAWLIAAAAQGGEARGGDYQIFVSNERSRDITIIDGGRFEVVGTLAVGKRPRGIHASPDGRSVYVALSGTPIEAPPQLDAQGNPIFKKIQGDDDDAVTDKSADGIGIVDVARRALVGRISVGSDPEEFALSADGRKLYVSNEDVKTASVVDIASARVEHTVPVAQEPEGVATAPDGRSFYLTCEAGGDIFVIDASTYEITAQFKVKVRPRSVDFLPDSFVALIPSESAGVLNVVDTRTFRITHEVALPPGSRPMHVRVAADGRKIYVSNGRAGTVSVVDAHSYALLNTIKVGTRPWGMAISPDGRYLIVANGPSNDISIVDLDTELEVRRIKVGSSPWGIAIVPNTDEEDSDGDWSSSDSDELPPGFERLPRGAVRPPDYKPRSTDPAMVARGKSLYTTLGCSFCHGADARGGNGGVSLLRSQKVLTDQKGERLYATVTKGVPGTAMAAFDLTPTQVADIAEFLHSFRVGGSDKARNAPASIVTGNAEVGRRYFERTCAACHSPSGDLRGIASRYKKPRALQQRWLLPRIAQKASVRVWDADGTLTQGQLVRRDEFLMTMMLEDGTQRTVRLEGAAPRIEISDPLARHKALLPTYSDQDIHDVTAYLVTLK